MKRHKVSAVGVGRKAQESIDCLAGSPHASRRRKKRATDVSKLSSWLAEPAAAFARGLSLPEKFGRMNEPKYDWDGWVCDQLSPELWRRGGWWTGLAPACVANRAATAEADESTIEDVKNDLVRLILHNIVARCCGFASIQDLSAEHKSRIRPTAADHAKSVEGSGGSKVTLGLLVELALALHAFTEHEHALCARRLDSLCSEMSNKSLMYLDCIAEVHQGVSEKRNTEAVMQLLRVIDDLNQMSQYLCVRDCVDNSRERQYYEDRR